MKKRCIPVPNGPPAKGPYSHAVAVGNLLFTSGQGPFTSGPEGVARGTIPLIVRDDVVDTLPCVVADARQASDLGATEQGPGWDDRLTGEVDTGNGQRLVRIVGRCRCGRGRNQQQDRDGE